MKPLSSRVPRMGRVGRCGGGGGEELLWWTTFRWDVRPADGRTKRTQFSEAQRNKTKEGRKLESYESLYFNTTNIL